MSAVFLYRRDVLARLAARAGAKARVEMSCVEVDSFEEAACKARVVVIPAEDLRLLQERGIPGGAAVVVYGRRSEREGLALPQGAEYLESPFRVDELAALLRPPQANVQWQSTGAAREHERPAQMATTTSTGALARPTAATTSARYKILAVDDDRILRRLYERVLGEVGYEVLLAEDGEDAWTKLPAFGPDVIISDVEMPRMDGYELCRRVKEYPQWAQTPFIVCSSLSGGRDVMRAFESGTDDYLIKPINEDELLSRVAEMLASIELGGREAILVVDDSRIVRNLVRGGLVKQGFEVEMACDGQDALERLAAMEVKPSIILSDFEMPRMNGFELGMALRGDPATKSIPLLVMSARDDRRYRSLMKTAGAVGYIGKPFEPDKLVALVERVLAEQRLKAEKARIRELVADDAVAQAVREVRLG
ncbi:MAG: response regulator, partial [Polyangiaceae bacterium]|nr:response regulator [Polyangiaceae bacterium]